MTRVDGAIWLANAISIKSRGSAPPDVTKPTILSRVVATDGLSIAITFDEDIQVSTLNLTLSVAGAARAYTSSVSGNVLTLAPSSVIYQGETVSIAYTSGISDLNGNEADASTANAVNNSTVVKPVVDPILAHFAADPTLKGFYFDPNDWSTLFQDATGTIPVTAVGQTVGKMLDKSGNGNHWVQSDVTKQYKLGQDLTTNSYCLLGDGVDDIASINIPNLVVSNSISFGFGVRRVSTGFIDSSYMLGYVASGFRHAIGLGANGVIGAEGAFYSEPNNASLKQMVVVSARNMMRGIISTSRNPSEMVNLYVNTEKYLATTLPINISNANYLDAKFAGYMYKGFLMNKKLNDFEHQEIHNFINLDVEAY